MTQSAHEPTQHGQPNYGQPSYGQPPWSGEPAYGQPAYGQPAYGQPAYGQPAYGPVSPLQATLPQPDKTNVLAILSLVFGILGGIPFSAVFGFIGLSQVKQRAEKGRGMAIAGLVLSGVWLVTGAIVVLLVILGDPTPSGASPLTTPSSGTSPTRSQPTTAMVEDLDAGQCVTGLDLVADMISNLPVVDCTSTHSGEVVSVFDLPGGSFRGDTAVQKEAKEKCLAQLDAYAPSAKRDPSITLFYKGPNKYNWDDGNRQVTCVAHFATPRKGTIKG